MPRHQPTEGGYRLRQAEELLRELGFVEGPDGHWMAPAVPPGSALVDPSAPVPPARSTR